MTFYLNAFIQVYMLGEPGKYSTACISEAETQLLYEAQMKKLETRELVCNGSASSVLEAFSLYLHFFHVWRPK